MLLEAVLRYPALCSAAQNSLYSNIYSNTPAILRFLTGVPSSWEMSESERASDEDSSDSSDSSRDNTSEDGMQTSGSEESGSDSGDDSSGGSDDSNSTSSGEDEDGSSSGGSDEESEDGEDEESEEEDEEEKRQASKQEDFEKMKELSAHMDNIVQRLSNFFPLDEDDERVSTPLPQPVPELPPLPKPEQLTEVRNTSVSARVMTMDRAVSARRLTTDRAVSVASGLHFEDEISSHSSADASQGEDAEHTENSIPGQFMKGAMRIHGGVAGKVSRREDGVEKFAGNRKNARGKVTAQKTRARTSSLLGDVRNTNASPGLGGQRPEEGGRTYSRPGDASGASYEADAFHEQLIWDELRDSLAGRDRGPPQKRHVRDTVEEAKRDIDSEERRRRLIEEAIAILLESSSDEEGVDGEGEDSGRR